jgi:hypothetical protein
VAQSIIVVNYGMSLRYIQHIEFGLRRAFRLQ